jgi:hypothetical protein
MRLKRSEPNMITESELRVLLFQLFSFVKEQQRSLVRLTVELEAVKDVLKEAPGGTFGPALDKRLHTRAKASVAGGDVLSSCDEAMRRLNMELLGL